jgi:5-(carboxyamino)imidazole ribonucleotide mutase
VVEGVEEVDLPVDARQLAEQELEAFAGDGAAVVGVPVQEKSVDSVIGMPSGAPIVAVDAGKAGNAALSAVQLLARQHAELRDRLVDRHTDLQDNVAAVSRDLHERGTPAYLQDYH